MTLPPYPPRSNTLDAIDNARWHVEHAREQVLREVAYLGGELDRLRAAYAQMKAERDAAVAALHAQELAHEAQSG